MFACLGKQSISPQLSTSTMYRPELSWVWKKYSAWNPTAGFEAPGRNLSSHPWRVSWLLI